MHRIVKQHFVIATATFLLSVALLGALQGYLLAEDSILVAIPAILWPISFLIGLILLAQLIKSRLLEVLCGVIILLLSSSILFDIPFKIADYWISVPRVLGGSVLLSVGITSLLKKSPLKVWSALTTSAIAGFTFVAAQAWLWQLTVPTDPETFENPIAQSVGGFACLVLAIAFPLAIKIQPASRAEFKSRVKHRFELMLTVACAILGTALWFAFAVQDLQSEQSSATKELEQLFANFSQELQQQKLAIERIEKRLANIHDSSLASALLQEDVATYVSDYSSLIGLMVVDEKQNFIFGNTYAQEVYQSIAFSRPTVKNWLTEEDLSHNTATLPFSTASGAALLMLREDLDTDVFPKSRLIALFDVYQLLNTQNFDTSFSRYWLVDNELVIPLDRASKATRTSMDEDQVNSPTVRRSFVVEPGNELMLFSTLNQNPRLRAEAIVNQIILFLCFLFIGIIAVNHKRALQLQAEKARLDNTSRHDQVTQLLRRQALGNELEGIPSESFVKSGMLFINLDGFQPINDSLGTTLGDELLSIVAQRLVASTPTHSLCARYSSDEFIVYLTNVSSKEVQEVALELLRFLRSPYYVGGSQIHLTASIGCALGKNTHNSPSELISQAEFAMREAKRIGGNLVKEFSPCMQLNYSRRAYLRTQLQSAIDNQELVVYYQPIVDATSSRIVAVESLVRWQHKEVFISPAEFIPIAERTGQIIPLGEQVLECVLSDAQNYPDLQRLQLSINISIQQLQRYEFPQLLSARLSSYNIAAKDIILELTEGVFIDPQDHHNRSLEQLLKLNCQLAIDDFGSGFSSLSYLHTIPAQIIKIDRSFITGIVEDSKRHELVKRVIELCKTLDKKIVVEGVETLEQVQLLRKIGIDRMQGFYFYRPMPIEELLSLLAAEKR